MKDNRNPSNTLIWFARICGLIISAIWLYYLGRYIDEVGFNSLEFQTSTGIILFLLIMTLSIGVGLAWKHPLSGGKFIMVVSVLLSIYNYFSSGDNRLIAIAFQGLPYFLIGLLFIQSQAAREKEN